MSIWHCKVKIFPAVLIITVLVSSPASAEDSPNTTTPDENSPSTRIIIGPRPIINQAIMAPPPPSSQFTYKVGGLLMYDAVWYQGKDALQELTTGYTDETSFRRARLFARGSAYEDWDYNMTLEFSDALNQSNKDNLIKILQASIAYSGFRTVKIKAGQLSEPFSLEGADSSNAIPFMERGLPYTFAPSRSVGIDISIAPARKFYLEAGGFTGDINASNNLKKAFTGRAAYAPIHTKGRILHLGTGASYRVPIENTVRYRARPESDLAPAWFSTGTIRNVDHIVLSGLEAAAVEGPVSLQAEYVRSDVSRSNGRQGRTIDGYYVYASWFLTGESRPYKNGGFDSIKPKNSGGAWEVAVRKSAIQDGNGQRLHDLTLGCNWYINKDARLMVNYVYANYKKNIEHGNANIFQMRGQIDF
jgi:phosphate-selective porin OprO and OprP